MNTFRKDFAYDVVDFVAAGNAGQILYDICDWIVNLGIGFTSYDKSEEIQNTTSTTKHKYWYADLKSDEVGKVLRLSCYNPFIFDSDGNIISFVNDASSGNGGYSYFYIKSNKFGECASVETNYSLEANVSLPTYSSDYSILKFTVTIYHKNNKNMIIGIEETASKSIYGFSSGIFIMLCTANGEQLFTNAKKPICGVNSSVDYSTLTDGIIQKRYEFRGILARDYLALSGQAMFVKVPLTLYGTDKNTGYDTLNFDYIYQTNKSYLETGSIYTINEKDYLCFDATMGMLMEC